MFSTITLDQDRDIFPARRKEHRRMQAATDQRHIRTPGVGNPAAPHPNPTARPIEMSRLQRRDVRLSSRELDWGPLHLERRESDPGSIDFAAGATEHLVFVSLGHARIRCERGTEPVELDIAPGYVAVQPSHTPARWSWHTRLSYVLLALDPAFLRTVAAQALGMDPAAVELVPGERESDQAISSIAGVLSRELMGHQPGARLYAESLAQILAVHLLRSYAKGPPPQSVPDTLPSRPVAQAIRYIQENFGQDIGLADIASAARLSQYHLARLFKQVTGVTPHQYLIGVRVNNARALLSAGAGKRSLADVAEAVGFADQSHLTRHVKRLLGVTPRELCR
jgi:AraC family transcriptional regulator